MRVRFMCLIGVLLPAGADVACAQSGTGDSIPSAGMEAPKEADADSALPGFLSIGSSTTDAFLYLNGVVQGPARLRTYTLRPGYVRVEIRAEGCESYRSVFLIRARETRRLGRRDPVCTKSDSSHHQPSP